MSTPTDYLPTVVFSLARKEREAGSRWFDLLVGATERQTVARLEHDGLDAAVAAGIVAHAANAIDVTDEVLDPNGYAFVAEGDVIDVTGVGAFGHAYRVQAISVYAPLASAGAA